MTKKGHHKFWRTKWKIVPGKRVRKSFRWLSETSFFRNRGKCFI